LSEYLQYSIENSQLLKIKKLFPKIFLPLKTTILELRCYPTKADATQATIASNRAAACSGKALRISFSTPEGEVKGVDPVKFIAR
jgi:hypothetical protein